MTTKLTRHGNDWALVIDQPMLDLLKIDPETPLEITIDERVLTITPEADADRATRFATALEQTNRRYGQALRKLAE